MLKWKGSQTYSLAGGLFTLKGKEEKEKNCVRLVKGGGSRGKKIRPFLKVRRGEEALRQPLGKKSTRNWQGEEKMKGMHRFKV